MLHKCVDEFNVTCLVLISFTLVIVKSIKPFSFNDKSIHTERGLIHKGLTIKHL